MKGGIFGLSNEKDKPINPPAVTSTPPPAVTSKPPPPAVTSKPPPPPAVSSKPPPPPAVSSKPPPPPAVTSKPPETAQDKNKTLKKVVVGSDKVAEPVLKSVDVVEKINENTKTLDRIGSVSSSSDSVINPLESIVRGVTELIKIHPLGHLIISTLLFIKKLKDLYKNHQQIVEFLTQVEVIVENSYRLNELIDKINEMMVIYTFNNEEYKNKYKDLFELEKQILNNKDDDSLRQLNLKEKELFDGLLATAINNKKSFRSNLNRIEFDNLDKFIEPNKLIKEQLTIRIAEINKYLLSIATNSMLETLKTDTNINKSGLIRLVLDEIKSREKRFKWLRDRKRDWDRVNNRWMIMRKLNDDLIIMNSLFILIKFQLDFTIEYYKTKSISPEEWNTLWKLMTSFKEYTSYMIPNEVFMTIKTINDIMDAEIAESKNAVIALGDIINELNDEEDQLMVEMKSLNEPQDEPSEAEKTVEETSLGGKNRRGKTRKLKNIKNKNINNINRKTKNRYKKSKSYKKSYNTHKYKS